MKQPRASPQRRHLALSLGATLAGVLAFALAVLPLATHGQTGDLEEFDEVVEVRRLLLDVRVVDPRREALRGLGPENFEVQIGPLHAEVEAADWLGPQVAPARLEEEEGETAAAATAAPYGGRLLVLFFQRDPNPSRAVGTIRMMLEARRFIDELSPGDRAAVLSYGHGLHLHADFTDDRESLHSALGTVVPFRRPDPKSADRALSLAGRLDLDQARQAPNVEQALALTARALVPLAGPKSLLFFGWGLGELQGGQVRPRPGFAEAQAALREGRITFFTLDVTQADAHTLEDLLRALSRSTGGIFQRAHPLPRVALRRVAEATAGHYELSVVLPELPPGVYRLRVRLAGERGTVFHEEYVQVR